jgi:glycosyltransferase involved in cell wall biosynthesis
MNEMERAAISICIPAFKRIKFIRRLLDSINNQTFRNFEVVICDDSPDDELARFCDAYKGLFPLLYLKNPAPLGTPENWNAAIRHARGEWIKLMHDDDWFTDSNSLQKFYELTKTTPHTRFVFSGSLIIDNDKLSGQQKISGFQLSLLKKDPANLFAKNVIGPPSVIMHKNDQAVWYDKRMKWLVDVDFYMRALKHYEVFAYTREPLISVGFSEVQVTKQVFHDKEVVIPETLLMLSKMDQKILLRLHNYDFAWRLMRNYHIRSARELEALKPAEGSVVVPALFNHIIAWQRLIPDAILKMGIFSKPFMFMNYLAWKLRS